MLFEGKLDMEERQSSMRKARIRVWLFGLRCGYLANPTAIDARWDMRARDDGSLSILACHRQRLPLLPFENDIALNMHRAHPLFRPLSTRHPWGFWWTPRLSS